MLICSIFANSETRISTYYLEWYNLTGEKICIKYAADILLAFFELAEYTHPAQSIEAVNICEALEKENLQELRAQLLTSFLRYVDNCSKETGIVFECSWCSEIPSIWLAYQSQAFILTGDKKFIDMAQKSLATLKAFSGNQPDFHLNQIPVRYWDRYWFGKYPSYGDVFPHYWSSLAAWGMAWYDKAQKTPAHQKEIAANLSGNLCLYREDGFAANNYLYPYKITLFTSDPDYKNPFLRPGITYGKNYDKWANDQDWALYYALRFLI